MKILHVITSLEIGGAQRLLADLLPEQKKSDDVSLLVYERVNNAFEKTIENAGIEIISLNEHNFKNPIIVFRMRNIFKRYDVVHAHLFPTLYWASLAAFNLKVKLVYTEHSTSNSRRYKWYFWHIERFIYNRYDRIISISQQTEDALTSWLKLHDGRFVVINNGVDIKRFSSVNKPVIPRSIIMVSRFAKSKDQETVIRSLPYLDDDVVLRLVGDGENKTYCETLVQNMGLSSQVDFLGSSSDVADLISESYIGVQSSNWEGFGLTAVEIMAASKPVLASDVDGLRQVVEGAGIIFPKGNEKKLADGINKLLRDNMLYDLISKSCYNRAKLFDIKLMADKYTRLYYELKES